MLANGEVGSVDFAFIDADKTGYPAYVERVTELLRPGGVMLLDNTDPAHLEEPSPDAELLDQLSQDMVADPRLTVAVIPLGSGMTSPQRAGDSWQTPSRGVKRRSSRSRLPLFQRRGRPARQLRRQRASRPFAGNPPPGNRLSL